MLGVFFSYIIHQILQSRLLSLKELVIGLQYSSQTIKSILLKQKPVQNSFEGKQLLQSITIRLSLRDLLLDFSLKAHIHSMEKWLTGKQYNSLPIMSKRLTIF